MTADVALRFPEWDLNKSRCKSYFYYDSGYLLQRNYFDGKFIFIDGETDFLPLMASPGPVLMILALYLLYVLKIGPALMTKREPFKLTSALLLYNGLQVAGSVYLVNMYFTHLMNHGVLPSTCYMNDSKERKQILLSIWLYFIAKVSELLDTVFFVLRKKDNQITFLHLYHHSIMMVGTWAFLKYWPSDSLFFIGFLNSLVHVFMYTYYGLSALGPKVAKYIFWKKYMTKFQLIQFVCIIIHYIIAVRTSECPPSKGVATFVASNCGFFLILFLNFYCQSYLKKSSVNRDIRLKTDKME